jgi:hypothetical protein
MSILDEIIAKVTPPESEEDRRDARETARRAAINCEWLGMVLDHHGQIEAAFSEAKRAQGAEARRAAQKQLAELLTGHSMAEEAVIYPHMALHDQKAHATMAYTEQSAATLQMGLLETLDPASGDWLDKLEHIEGAVKHHVYEEEGTWFPDLARAAPAGHNATIARRYREEYERYMGGSQPRDTSLGGTEADDFMLASHQPPSTAF